MKQSAEEVARLSTEAMRAEDNVVQSHGIEILETGPGRAVAAMTVQSLMINGLGLCHGGFVFLLADTAFAYACNSHGRRTVAQQAAVTFFAPGKLGDRLIAEAVERQRGERSGLTDVTVRNERRETIAEFRRHSRTISGSLLPAG